MKVVNLKSESKSFSWNDGLFAIDKEVDDTLYLWKIKKGKLVLYPDKSPVIICVSRRNRGLESTDLKIKRVNK